MTTDTNLIERFNAHAHDMQAFLISFGDFGRADIDASVGHIADVSELDYVYANQNALQTLMDDFEKALRPRRGMRQKASRWLTSIGIADTKLQKLSDDMENHRQAILVENAKYRQTQRQLATIQTNMLASIASITSLLDSVRSKMNSQVLERVMERQVQLQTQLTVVTQALQAVEMSVDQNKDIVDTMRDALSTGVSAHRLHEVARKLKGYADK